MSQIKGIRVNGISYDLELTDLGYFDTKKIKDYIDEKVGPSPSGDVELIDENGEEYILKVDVDGNLYTQRKYKNIDRAIIPTPYSTKEGIRKYKLYINSLYCGGYSNEHNTDNYCSHNFIELCYLGTLDKTNDEYLNLSGLSVQYTMNGQWEVLPLPDACIKKGETFLIRGAQCAPKDSAVINVDEYDMIWKHEVEYPIEGTDPIQYKTVIEDINFSIETPSFCVCIGTDAICSGNIQITANTNTNNYDDIIEKYKGRILDVFGFKTEKSTIGCSYYKEPFYPKSEIAMSSDTDLNDNLKNKIIKRYYSLDQSFKQSDPTYDERNTKNDFTFVDLRKDNVFPNIKVFTPKPMRAHKNFFYDKTSLLEDKPSVITCSFGIQATDGGEGKRATRCFNWISKGKCNEFLWVRRKGTSEWNEYESYKNSTKEEYVYNRKTIESPSGELFTVHKYIVRGLEHGEYEYMAGHKGLDGKPNYDKCTDIRTFTVRTDDDVNNGFAFVQTSDQQGFNRDEYLIWKSAANCIEREDINKDIQFMINTGDMTQNGNRIHEWLDYFNFKSNQMKNMEEMATVGNNDLSSKETYKLHGGKDTDKYDIANYDYFYTTEMDSRNYPIFTNTNAHINSVYIPSLYSFNYGDVHFICMNTEIKSDYEKNMIDTAAEGKLYPLIRTWLENDINNDYDADGNRISKLRVMYCHEMPFTIITTGDTKNDLPKNPIGNRGNAEGCHADQNTNGEKWWLGEFCQNNDIPLVLGGHKHTQSTSWPLLENVDYTTGRTVYPLKPIIVFDKDEDIDEFIHTVTNNVSSTGNTLIELNKYIVYNTESEVGNRIKYQDTSAITSGEYIIAFKGDKYPTYVYDDITAKTINGAYITGGTLNISLFKCEMYENISANTTPVIYAMSQATSYKHTSNRELPSYQMSWLRNFYPSTTDDKANGGQLYPFYTLWTIKPNDDMTSGYTIEGNVRKVVGAFYGKEDNESEGKFEINMNGENILSDRLNIGKQSKDNKKDYGVGIIHSINGLRAGISHDSTEKIKISRKTIKNSKTIQD